MKAIVISFREKMMACIAIMLIGERHVFMDYQNYELTKKIMICYLCFANRSKKYYISRY
jgi:hypothetical protein